MSNAAAVRRQIEAKAALDLHRKQAAERDKELVAELQDAASNLMLHNSDIDVGKVELAETIIYVTDYSRGGEDRGSCVKQALKQFAMGSETNPYLDLWRVYLGTKSYDRWHGQRSDHEYGYGPRHGSVIFRIGVHDAVRHDRKQSDLTAEEVDACVYYLLNIGRIQDARKSVKAA